MSDEYIDPQLIETLGNQLQNEESHRSYNTRKVLLALMQKVLGHGYIENGEMIDSRFCDQVHLSAPLLFTVDTLRKLSLYQDRMQHEIWPDDLHPRQNQLFAKDKVRLVYSFIYQMIDPSSDKINSQKFRIAIQTVLRALDLGDPLTKEEILQNTHQLVAIANEKMIMM